jgi:hypothetical protein
MLSLRQRGTATILCWKGVSLGEPTAIPAIKMKKYHAAAG